MVSDEQQPGDVRQGQHVCDEACYVCVRIRVPRSVCCVFCSSVSSKEACGALIRAINTTAINHNSSMKRASYTQESKRHG